jgi:hypothetical protein
MPTDHGVCHSSSSHRPHSAGIMPQYCTDIYHSCIWEQYPCIKMNFKSAIEQHYACRTSTIPTAGRSAVSHTKNVNFGGTADKEVVIFLTRLYREHI